MPTLRQKILNANLTDHCLCIITTPPLDKDLGHGYSLVFQEKQPSLLTQKDIFDDMGYHAKMISRFERTWRRSGKRPYHGLINQIVVYNIKLNIFI